MQRRHLWQPECAVWSSLRSPCSFPSEAPPAAAHESVWRYAIRPGDNIWNLSRRYLADGRNWTVIQEINGIDEPRRIPPVPGSRLDIPLRLLRLELASATCRGERPPHPASRR